MNKKKLANFLVKAKLNTYASSGEGEEKIIIDGSKELTFEEKKIKYKDCYFGYNPFIGEEIVWENNKIIWGMNYYGQVISKTVPSAKIYKFLKEALKTVKENKPFRGANKYKRGDFEYINKIEGDIKNFKGKEKIFCNNKLAYILTYHGGFIQKKI
ncbi:MAG: DUF5680 domain-containing protein [Patescibacteria group bacterium]|nr:DUF5680 domain-containing protein [Patescibacteria group bacterium]